MADAKLVGLGKIKAKLAKLPRATETALRGQLDTEAKDLVEADKRAAVAQGVEPVARAVHYKDAPNRVIGVVIIADPKDGEGKDIGSNIEAGHKARDGGRVRPIPSFFPTYRARKKAMQARLRKAGRDAIKQAWEA